jgi:hypothetical protein
LLCGYRAFWKKLLGVNSNKNSNFLTFWTTFRNHKIEKKKKREPCLSQVT